MYTIVTCSYKLIRIVLVEGREADIKWHFQFVFSCCSRLLLALMDLTHDAKHLVCLSVCLDGRHTSTRILPSVVCVHEVIYHTWLFHCIDMSVEHTNIFLVCVIEILFHNVLPTLRVFETMILSSFSLLYPYYGMSLSVMNLCCDMGSSLLMQLTCKLQD